MKDIISITMGELTTAFDNEVVKAVQKVGIDVDKEELLKALDLYHNLVRCGECKHCDKGSDRVTGQTVFICQRKNDENLWEKMNADDFCSYGEREGE